MNLEHLFDAIGPLITPDDVDDLRAVLDGFAGMLNDDLPSVGAFHPAVPYREVDGPTLTLDVFVPSGSGPFPVLVYLHGGAWVWGSPATHRKLTCRLAEQGFVVMSVDYRLAPEHPFPAGFNDCTHAVHFAVREAARFGGDAQRLVLAGDSAGANLAAAIAVHLADGSAGAPVRAVGLLYGVYDFSGLESGVVTRMLVDAYLGNAPGLVQDPRVSPIVKAGVLPPAHIAVGSADPLIEDAEALRAKLARRGKVHDYRVYEDMPHAFMQMEFFDEAQRAIRAMTDFLHETVDG
ncbi:MAG: alpha/beta hydrolase fold domain-containing protein [Pseudomonadales bacterium]